VYAPCASSVVVLPNGLLTVAAARPGSANVHVEVAVRAGLRHEPEGQNGVAHMLEHLLGYETRRFSGNAVLEESDRLGGQFGGGVRWEFSRFHLTVLPELLEDAVSLLADMTTASRMTDALVEREKRVILEEIAHYADSPDMLLMERVSAAVFPEHPLGRPICGTEASVRQLTSADLERYHNAHYHPDNAVVVLVGDASVAEMQEMAEKHLGGWTGRSTASPQPVPTPAASVRKITERMLLNQAIVIVGLPTVGLTHRHAPHLEVAAQLLGSAAQKEIRGRHGLAYRTGSLYRGISDLGVLVVFAGTSSRQREEVATRLHEMVFARATLTPEAVERARRAVLMRYVLRFERNAEYSRHLSEYASMGHLEAGMNWLERLREITVAQMHEVWQQHIQPGQEVLAQVLPLRGVRGLYGAARLLWNMRKR